MRVSRFGPKKDEQQKNDNTKALRRVKEIAQQQKRDKNENVYEQIEDYAKR